MLGIPFIDQAIFKIFRPKTLGDGSDRLSSSFTTTICALLAIMVSTKQYVGHPITCWMPTEFKGTMEAYTQEYCFITNTYHVPHSKINIPEKHLRDHNTINYYQWVPMILFFQAVAFYLPNFFWKKLNKKINSFDAMHYVTQSQSIRNQITSKRAPTVTALAEVLNERVVETPSDNMDSNRKWSSCGGRSFAYFYIFTKIFYAVNAFIQFVLISNMLDIQESLWTFKSLFSIVSGGGWLESESFPRVTFCDIAIRDLGNVRNYSVQCLLMINMINEKIFFFEWFWFAIISVVATVSCFFWIKNIFSWNNRLNTIRKWLRPDKLSEYEIRKYAHILNYDGYVILSFVNIANGSKLTSEIVNESFNMMKQNKIITDFDDEKRRSSNLDSDISGCLEKKHSNSLASLARALI